MATYAARHRSRLPSRKIPLRILCVWLLAALCSLTGGQEVYPSPHGPFWCYPCQPGFHVTVHCTQDHTYSSCTPCPKDTYKNDFNSNTFCEQCIPVECPDLPGYQLQACSATQQADCLCQEGYYKVSENSSIVKCRIHSECQSGEGEVYYGNMTHDTQCRQCIQTSEYVDRTHPGHPKCQNCSTCDGNFSTDKSCTLFADTICKANSPQDSKTEVPELTFTGEALETTGQTESDSMIGIIIGLIVAIFVILVAIVFIVICFCRKRRNRQDKYRNETAKSVNNEDTPLVVVNNEQKSTDKFVEKEKFIGAPTEKYTEEITVDGAPTEKSSNGETTLGNVIYDEENRDNETKVNLSEKSQLDHSDDIRA